MFENLNDRYPNLKGKLRLKVRPIETGCGYVPMFDDTPALCDLEDMYKYLKDPEVQRVVRCQ